MTSTYLAAKSALESLNKWDIEELKSFVKPPEPVVMLAHAICVMMGKPQRYTQLADKVHGYVTPNQYRYNYDIVYFNIYIYVPSYSYAQQPNNAVCLFMPSDKLFHCSTMLLHTKLLSFHSNTYDAMILYVGY